MKIFDVFIKDRFKEVDILVKDRLKEIDIIIKNLVSRTQLSIEDVMIIKCIMDEINIIKKIKVKDSFYINTETARLSAEMFALIKKNPEIILSNKINISGLKKISTKLIDLDISSSPVGIYYFAAISGQSLLNIFTSNIADLYFKTVLHAKNNFKMLINCITEANSLKYVVLKNISKLSNSIEMVLNKIIRTKKSAIHLSSDSVDLKFSRKRLLGEMDFSIDSGVELTLGDFDNLSIINVDYVYIDA